MPPRARSVDRDELRPEEDAGIAGPVVRAGVLGGGADQAGHVERELPVFVSICLTKLAKGSEVLRAKTQTTGAAPYHQR
jgi:hypothetical protein